MIRGWWGAGGDGYGDGGGWVVALQQISQQHYVDGRIDEGFVISSGRVTRHHILC